jgi:phage shock protein C
MDTQKSLTRSRTDKMFLGVCGGLARYLNIDPVWVRLAFVALFFIDGISLLAYIILAIVMPEEGAQTVPASAGNGRRAAADQSKVEFEPLGSRDN